MQLLRDFGVSSGVNAVERGIVKRALANHLLSYGLLLAAFVVPVHGQDDGEEGRRVRFPLWTATLPAGTYAIALNSISSVSQHEYLVDGAARVSEVTISATGPSLARFYFIEPVAAQSPVGLGQSIVESAKERAAMLTERTGTGEVWTRVVKSYPATTHAHTVEYRLESREQLDALFRSALDSWKWNRSAHFKVGE